MAEKYLGQIVLTGFNFAPKNFAVCNGQTLAIQQNAALFALLGTAYGGNGTNAFQLPNLCGATPYGQSGTQPAGAFAGVEAVTLTPQQVPGHTHAAKAITAAGSARNPGNGLFGDTGALPIYAAATGPQVPLNAATLSTNGSTQPHSNMQPYCVVNFCIALVGIFPSQN